MLYEQVNVYIFQEERCQKAAKKERKRKKNLLYVEQSTG